MHKKIRAVYFLGRGYLHLVGLIILTILLLILSGCSGDKTSSRKGDEMPQTKSAKSEPQDGDVIFQVSSSGQAAAIQEATGSKYSHCGLILRKKEKLLVLEAVQPVKITPFEKWVKQGENGHYVVKRLKNASEALTPAVLAKMKEEGKKYLGKNYDLTFRWSDDRIYCSELVWKIYDRAAGIQLTSLDKFRDFDLTGGETRKILKARFGENVPLDEKAISPGKLFESDLLETVVSKN
jgi:hypothetical protein